jgi:hypothetical protein
MIEVRLSKDELLRESGADPEELADLESRLIIQPKLRWLLFGRFIGPEEYYTEGQLEILRRFASKNHRAAAA